MARSSRRDFCLRRKASGEQARSGLAERGHDGSRGLQPTVGRESKTRRASDT